MSLRTPTPASSLVPPAMAAATGGSGDDGGAARPIDDLSRWFEYEIRPLENMLRQYLRGRFPTLEVDDVMQESYFRLFKVHGATPIRNPRGFLIGIARHVAHELLRRRRLFSVVPVDELHESASMATTGDVAEAINRQQELDLVAAAINALPDRCREIVARRTLQRMSYADIARELGLAEDTVRVQMARGIKKCVHHLRALGVTATDESARPASGGIGAAARAEASS